MSRIVVHVADLVALTAELRRAADDYDTSVLRLSRVADDLPPSLDELGGTVRRAVSRLRRIAAESRDQPWAAWMSTGFPRRTR